MPVVDVIPYSVIILVVVAVLGALLMRSSYGRTLIAVGDNPEAAAFAGTSVWWTKTWAFILSSLSATIAGILLVGYAGVHPSVGQGYEFQAITAVVLGGVVLGGGRGWVLSAAAGAFALELLLRAAHLPGRRVDLAQHRAGRDHHPRRGRVGPRLDPRASPLLFPRITHRTRGGPTCPTAHAVGHRHRRTLMRRKSIRGAAGSGRGRSPAGGADRLQRDRQTQCGRRPGRLATTSEPTRGGDRGRRRRHEWFDQALFDEQDEQRSATFEGDPEEPYLQYIDGEMTDTSDYKSDGAKKVCFANASISNPWRQTGWITMNQQLKVLQDEGVISEMETRDAEDDDNTQIADIDYFISEGNCDAFVISPNSTAAMTPAVERACDTGKPVIVFDRGVETDCATTFIHPIGGFAWGIDTAKFLIDNLEEGDKVVALRILPGVDVLEQRWAAAEKLFDEAGIEAVDYFTGADPTEIKKIISDELAKGDVAGRLDGRR